MSAREEPLSSGQDVSLLMARHLPSAGISTKRAETPPRIDRRQPLESAAQLYPVTGLPAPNVESRQREMPLFNRLTEARPSLFILKMKPREPTQSETALLRWQAVLVSLSIKRFLVRRRDGHILTKKKRLMASWRLLCTVERAKDRIVRASTATQSDSTHSVTRGRP